VTIQQNTIESSSNHDAATPLARLDSLTSLRFFAAAMVLLFHMAGEFGFIENTFLAKIALWQGVTFFFVLSGFILTYVHPDLAKTGETRKFLIARFARIWPTHVTTLLLTFCTWVECDFDAAGGWVIFIVNLLALQSWTLNPQFFMALNAPSWSISTEFFFYLSFPFLINSLKRNWLVKLALALSFSLGSLLLACWFDYGNYSKVLGWTPDFIVVNPLCRLFEFTLGMALALVFRNFTFKFAQNTIVASLIELIAIIGICYALMAPIAWTLPSFFALSEVSRNWFTDCSIAPFYGFLILTAAFSRGLIFRLLSWKVFIHLGEISFSLYMVHSIVLQWFHHHSVYFLDWSIWQKSLVAAALCLLLARINYCLIETPCRKWIVDTLNNTAKVFASRKNVFKLPLLELLAVFALCFVLAAHGQDPQVQSKRISNSEKSKAIDSGTVHPSKTLFGRQAWLVASNVHKDSQHLEIILIWESPIDQFMSFKNTIYLLDKDGRTLMQKAYNQDNHMLKTKTGKLWRETIVLQPDSAIVEKTSAVGISIRDNNQLLTVQNGTRDQNNSRLLLSVEFGQHP
jgi:peptidoglycan/LPS O-acetylase OafA/YrhL